MSGQYIDQLSTTIDPTTCKIVEKARGGTVFFFNLGFLLYHFLSSADDRWHFVIRASVDPVRHLKFQPNSLLI